MSNKLEKFLDFADKYWVWAVAIAVALTTINLWVHYGD